ncbi:MAG: macro domain-containing protein, partial [Myxococcota bacterium]
GAITAEGGSAIAEECAEKAPIQVGQAVATGAGDLPARYVIHAAGMPAGGQASEVSVREAFRDALREADRVGCRTLACPAIGAGIGGLSVQASAEICLDEARKYARRDGQLEEIRFVLFGEPAFRIFEMVSDAAKVEAEMRRLRSR